MLRRALRWPLRSETRPRHPPLEEALEARVARAPGSRARDWHTANAVRPENATIVFDTGDGAAWTIRVQGPSVSLALGRVRHPTATVLARETTLVDVLEGRRTGVEAFLAGDLAIRGNLALPLELDDLLPPLKHNPRSPRCRRVTANGVVSFYLEAGEKTAPPVVLLHGLGGTSASFLPMLWDLARDYHVIAVDLPGFGESGKPMRPLHAAYFARWAASFLDEVGIERCHLVGNSMGGRIALEVALCTPARVEKLVLLAPSLAWRRYRAAASLVRFLRPELAVLPLPVLHRLVTGVLRGLFARPERVPAAAIAGAADEFVRIFATPRGRIAFFHAAREIYLEEPSGSRGFWDRLGSLSTPSLFIFGQRDRLVPRGFVRHVRAALPNATCEVFDDCGHVPQFELPDRTNRRVRAFFAGA